MAYFHFPNLSRIKEDLNLKSIDEDRETDMEHILTVNLDNDLTPSGVWANTDEYDVGAYKGLRGKELGGEKIKVYKNNSSALWKEIADSLVPGVEFSSDCILRYYDTGGDLREASEYRSYATNHEPMAVGQYLMNYVEEANSEIER